MSKEVKKQENKQKPEQPEALTEENKPKTAEQPDALAEGVQAFIQRKLQILNQKKGARYERDAARVVRRNIQG